MSLMEGGYAIRQEIKSVLKVYPDFARLHEYNKPFIVQRFDFNEDRPFNPDKKSFPKPDPEDYAKVSLAKAKTRVVDLALANKWELFVTITFSKDRQNVDAKKRQIAFWLNNQRNLHGKFSYLLVPEYHSDKVSIHFHGLFKDYKGVLKDSGVTQKGRTVFNIQSFRGGFTTAVKIDNIPKVAGYISKYLTKEMPKFKNKQRYWCSNGLARPQRINNPLLTKEDLELFFSIFKGKQTEVFEYQGRLSPENIERISNYGKLREDTLLVSEL